MQPAIDNGIDIAVILLLGILIRFLVVKLVKRIVRHARTPPNERRRSRLLRRGVNLTAWAGEREAQRSAALGSLVISITTVVVGLACLLAILGVLGVNLTPILASAGVLGVVIGFGAQNLVKDLISGIGMLLEDQFGIGDVIDMDKASGTVEAVGLRVTRLRDPAGVIWYVRNGEVLRVGNKSKGWSEVVVDLDVDAKADLAAATEVVTRVAAEVAAAPEFAAALITAPTLVGIEGVSGTEVNLRIHGTARTGDGAPIERALRYRLKLALDEAGIKLAPVPAG
jgi:moderate conductance mechanosensitive channel